MSADLYRSFDCFGSEVRLYIGRPVPGNGIPAGIAATGIEALFKMIDARLSRFRPDSELCRLNDAPDTELGASPLLRLCVKAAVHVGELSGGLVVPTVIGDLERAGYRESRARAMPARLVDAIAAAPPRRPALPAKVAAWRRFTVDDDAGTVSRPPGMRIDSGGVGKGIAADMAIRRLAGFARALVDAGGDMRARVGEPDTEPFEVLVEHPLTGETAHRFELRNAGIATSGLATRIWHAGGGYAHHLIDPGRGTPAWTGVIQATAIADSALEAETLAKMAMLGGPQRARRLLAERGGAIVLDDGSVEVFEPAAAGREARGLAA